MKKSEREGGTKLKHNDTVMSDAAEAVGRTAGRDECRFIERLQEAFKDACRSRDTTKGKWNRSGGSVRSLPERRGGMTEEVELYLGRTPALPEAALQTARSGHLMRAIARTHPTMPA